MPEAEMVAVARSAYARRSNTTSCVRWKRTSHSTTTLMPRTWRNWRRKLDSQNVCFRSRIVHSLHYTRMTQVYSLSKVVTINLFRGGCIFLYPFRFFPSFPFPSFFRCEAGPSNSANGFGESLLATPAWGERHIQSPDTSPGCKRIFDVLTPNSPGKWCLVTANKRNLKIEANVVVLNVAYSILPRSRLFNSVCSEIYFRGGV